MQIAYSGGAEQVEPGVEFLRNLKGSAPAGRYRVIGFEGGAIYSPSGLGGSPVITAEHIETGEQIDFCGDSVARMIADTKILEYLESLKLGERVIETGQCALKGRLGWVVQSSLQAGVAIQWDTADGETGRLTTSPTWGTKRLDDVE